MGGRNRYSRSLAHLSIYLFLALSLAACQAQPAAIPAVTATLANTATPASTATPAPPPGTFWVETTQDLGEISKFVLGANHGPLWALGPGNIEPVKNAGVTFLRWPGGAWGDHNDIQPFYIDLYMNEARIAGAEPSITVRLPNSTPEAAAALVRYVNVDMQYGIKYWSIGNEPSLYEQDTSLKGQAWDAVTYAKRWREFALAMKAADSTIKLYGPDTHQFKGDPAFDPKDSQGRDYLREFLKVNADLVDIVSVHRYPFSPCLTCKPLTPADLLANTPEWDDIIPNLRRVVKDVTGKDLPVGVMEYNSNTSNIVTAEASPDSFPNAIWLADVLGRMIRHRPDMLAYWQLKSTGSGHGLMDSYNLRPTYYVFQIYKRFGNHLLAAQSPEDMVSVFAARKDDGTITVILVNRGETAVTKPLKLEQGDALKLGEARLFDKEHKAEAVTLPAFTNGAPVELAGYSVTLLVFNP